MNQTIKTPTTHPAHETVGSYFQGYSGAVYFCDSYDPRSGFWMTNILDDADRRNVSERAIGRTFHEKLGHVRPHHKHHDDHKYHSVNIGCPDAEPQPFASSQAAAHCDPQVLVFFDRHYALSFQRSLRTAATAVTSAAPI
jgi:hypothetical protein